MPRRAGAGKVGSAAKRSVTILGGHIGTVKRKPKTQHLAEGLAISQSCCGAASCSFGDVSQKKLCLSHIGGYVLSCQRIEIEYGELDWLEVDAANVFVRVLLRRSVSG